MTNRFSNLNSNKSYQGRLERLETSYDLLLNHPVLGYGPNAFAHFYIGEGGEQESPHNLVTEIGIEYGLLEVIILGLAYLQICMKLIKSLNYDKYEINEKIFLSSILWIMLFWLFQVPFMGVASGKFAALFMGMGWKWTMNMRYKNGRGYYRFKLLKLRQPSIKIAG